jgi:DNA-binding GntR family transcriptional regulator
VSTIRGRSGGGVATVPAVPPRRRRQLLTQWSDAIAGVYEYRLALEPLAAWWAAERGSAVQGRQLAALAGETPADLGGYHQLDAQLHLLVAAMSGHLLLLEAITRAREEFRVVNTLWLAGAAGAGGLGSFVGFGREHEPVCTAIADRDPEAAHAAMAAHLREARDQFAALVTSFDQGGGG